MVNENLTQQPTIMVDDTTVSNALSNFETGEVVPVNADSEMPAVSNTQDDKSGLSTGAAIGLGVGAACSVAAIGYGCYKLYKYVKVKWTEHKAKKAEEKKNEEAREGSN